MDRPSRARIFARRQRRLLRPFLGVLVLSGLALGGWEGTRIVQNEERFAPLRARLGQKVALRVHTITVEGREMTSEAELSRALGVKPGDDILGFSVEAARRRIDALPFVEHAAVERRLPDTIFVKLTERRPYAVWQNQGRFVLIDRKGAVVDAEVGANGGISAKDAQAFAKLPLVVGEGAPEAAGTLIAALDAQPEVQKHVVAAVRVSRRRWNLSLRNGCIVLLPENQEVAALQRLAELQRQQQLLVRPLQTIDLRLPDRMVIHPRPQPDAPSPDNQPETATAPAGDASAEATEAKPARSNGAAADAARHSGGSPGQGALAETGRRPA
ncbi:cell division protein FtsQ/DivIB [Rhizosaccharibacter radicis]|uniref:Cell division protein FtsQ n=1 Tax=Rhizosaccharibacter radicis TaxID=2782605 RepID=A0ABT1VZV6_9PROT|nr:cell division protein FtsQ/DivIB [Acetobacteraceae bacterium KSS12]